MSENSLEITKSFQIHNPKDRKIFRFFEIIPGLLSWLTLFLAFWLSKTMPILVIFFIIAFDIIWLLRIFYLSLCQIASFKKLKKNLKINWLEKLQKDYTDSWSDIYHIITLPTYKEGSEIIDSSCRALENCIYPKDKMIVVLAIEERGGEEAKKIAKQIQDKYEKIFFRFLITVHPKDIEGEVAGKGSNVSWALKKVKEIIVVPLKIPYQNIIVSNFDIDTKPYPNYFSVLTWNYLKAEFPLRSSYQPIPVYNNNIWDAPAFSRIIASSSTFWQMMQQERQEQLVTYSSHSFPFTVFADIGYPSKIVSDDSNVFWKAYLFYQGDYRVVPLYYPVSMDTVMAKNLWLTIVNQYKQQRRWAWGSENIPYLFYNFFKDKKLAVKEKIRHSLVMIEGFWSWSVSALLIFFLGWLPIFLGGEKFHNSLLFYSIPRLTSNLMTISMFGMVISAGMSFLLLPPRPANYGRIRSLSMILQWLLLPITLILFGSFPAIDAQTRLMLGKELGFWPTAKSRKL
ncbi:hypothetical protein KKA72_02220 [Patescibacteria group bacterium]|nr:hypothetical protein [Patescibacteria group bacterium]MBU1877138.1 hypothetical protein [Patescibacteria group bacterium]